MLLGPGSAAARFRRTTSGEGPTDWPQAPPDHAGASAADVLRVLAPGCSAAVLARLRRESILTAVDLAGLDKEDLRELGLSMLERSRVLRWARSREPDPVCMRSEPSPSSAETGLSLGALSDAAALRAGPREPTPPPCSNRRGERWEHELPLLRWTSINRFASTLADSSPSAGEEMRPHREDHQEPAGAPRLLELEQRELVRKKLDEVEQRADFWCSIVTSAPPLKPTSLARKNSQDEEMSDLRENVLEELFDLSLERVEQLYQAMVRGTGHGAGAAGVPAAELRKCLRRCGLPELDDDKLELVMRAVSTHQGAGLRLAEFEAILSRMKLAQLLSGTCRLPLDKDTLGGRRIVLGQSVVRWSSCPTSTELAVVDYSPQSLQIAPVPKAKHKEFFFGHRKAPREGEPPLVRWVHMSGLDLTLILALTVKYGLHPLCVEDVIEQCPTKMDRYGCHYFAAVEQLCLVSEPNGESPVKVHGRHVAVFCSGPPLFDTILTVTEPDHDEKEDWPGGPVRDCVGAGDAWVTRLRQRLEGSHSRLRERRADFLMHQILDLMADELVKVTHAYTSRLSRLEEKPHISATGLAPEWLDEVSLIQMQLVVVARRLKGLQRLIRRLSEDKDLNIGLGGYVADVKDHIDEAHEDVTYLIEKCRNLIESSERALERHHAYCRQRAEDRLNSMVFVLTVATAIFAPVQFLGGVYGMNFQLPDGKPAIPELRWAYGYLCFWCVVITYLLVAGTCAVRLYRRFRRKVLEDYGRIAGPASSRPSAKPPAARSIAAAPLANGAGGDADREWLLAAASAAQHRPSAL